MLIVHPEAESEAVPKQEQMSTGAAANIDNPHPFRDDLVEEVQFGAQECLDRSEEHTSELQSRFDLVCRLLVEKKKSTCCCVSRATSFFPTPPLPPLCSLRSDLFTLPFSIVTPVSLYVCLSPSSCLTTTCSDIT